MLAWWGPGARVKAQRARVGVGMADARKVFVLSLNDLEAKTISGLIDTHLVARGWAKKTVDVPWGGSLEDVLSVGDLAEYDEVVILELPAPALEEALREAGKRVTVLDHHLSTLPDGTQRDLRQDKSTLEQFWAMFLPEQPMTLRERAIAANDRGFWPGMLGELSGLAPQVAIDTALAIRAEDRAFQAKGELADLSAAFDRFFEHRVISFANADADQILTVLVEQKQEIEDPKLCAAVASALGDILYMRYLGGDFDQFTGILGQTDNSNERKPFKDWDVDDQKKKRIDYVTNNPVEIITLLRNDAGEPDRLRYSGPPSRQTLVDEFIAGLADNTFSRSDFTVFGGGGPEGCYFGVNSPRRNRPSAIMDIADALVAEFLYAHRPLDRWVTSFVQFLRLSEAPCQHRDGADFAGKRVVAKPFFASSQEQLYFTDALRPVLTSPEMKDAKTPEHDALRVQSYEVSLRPCDPPNDEKKEAPLPKLSVLAEKAGGWTGEQQISNLYVHFLPDQQVALEWVTHGGASGGDGGLFKRMLCGSTPKTVEDNVWTAGTDDLNGRPPPHNSDPSVTSLADLLNFNNLGRLCYSAYRNYDEKSSVSLLVAGKVVGATRMSEDVVAEPGVADGWFGALVDLALASWGRGRGDVTLLLDERARIVSTAVPHAAPPKLPQALAYQDYLRSCLATVERPGPNNFYHAPFVTRELEQISYHRFTRQERYPGAQQTYAMTDQSLTLLGHGWFAANFSILHMTSMYRRIFLLEVMLATIFGSFGRRLAELSAERGAEQAKTLQIERDLKNYGLLDVYFEKKAALDQALDDIATRVGSIKESAVAVANAFYAVDASTQMQGREMHDKIAEAVGAKAHYDEMMAEISRSDALETADAARRAERRREELTALGVVGTLMLFTINVFADHGNKVVEWVLKQVLAGAADTSPLIWGGVGVALLVLIFWLGLLLSAAITGRSARYMKALLFNVLWARRRKV